MVFKAAASHHLVWVSAQSALTDHEQWLAVFDRLAIVDEDGLDGAAGLGFDFVEQFHRLNNA